MHKNQQHIWLKFIYPLHYITTYTNLGPSRWNVNTLIATTLFKGPQNQVPSYKRYNLGDVYMKCYNLAFLVIFMSFFFLIFFFRILGGVGTLVSLGVVPIRLINYPEEKKSIPINFFVVIFVLTW